MAFLILEFVLRFSHSIPNLLATFFRSTFFFNSRSLHSGFVGWSALMKTAGFCVLNFLMTSRFLSAFIIYSLPKSVCTVESIMIFAGSSVKHTEMMASFSPFSADWTLRSDLSHLTTPLVSLKKMSKASRIVDLPISFLPMRTVRSSKSTRISSR